MCVVTFPSRLNRTARSRRAGPRARRPPDQLAWQTLSRSAREGGEQLPFFSISGHIGNAMVRLPRKLEADPVSLTAQGVTPRVSWDFSKIPVFPPDRENQPQPSSPLDATPLPSAIQKKLVVGQINDPLEHEADRIADQVMRMPDADCLWPAHRYSSAGDAQPARKRDAGNQTRRSTRSRRQRSAEDRACCPPLAWTATRSANPGIL
jgi:hypothetical protein